MKEYALQDELLAEYILCLKRNLNAVPPVELEPVNVRIAKRLVECWLAATPTAEHVEDIADRTMEQIRMRREDAACATAGGRVAFQAFTPMQPIAVRESSEIRTPTSSALRSKTVWALLVGLFVMLGSILLKGLQIGRRDAWLVGIGLQAITIAILLSKADAQTTAPTPAATPQTHWSTPVYPKFDGGNSLIYKLATNTIGENVQVFKGLVSVGVDVINTFEARLILPIAIRMLDNGSWKALYPVTTEGSSEENQIKASVINLTIADDRIEAKLTGQGLHVTYGYVGSISNLKVSDLSMRIAYVDSWTAADKWHEVDLPNIHFAAKDILSEKLEIVPERIVPDRFEVTFTGWDRSVR